jgi:two-component system copper resistance phosphate regulon response regulator CusR
MRIMIVEDDEKVAGFIKKGLMEENYGVDLFHDGEEGEFWGLENKYDLIILDIMLPKKNGIDVCRSLRQKGVIAPILMLTARNLVDDRVDGLDAGADDYLPKPFSFDELLARIRALLRRSHQYQTPKLLIDDLELDPAARRVVRNKKEISLTGKEYALLEYLMRNKGSIVSETRIIDHVWDMNYDPGSNVVNVYIHHLRNKIDKGFENKLLHTIRGSGYRMS